MSQPLFNEILDQIVQLPVYTSIERKSEIYQYIFGLVALSTRSGKRTLITEGAISTCIYFLVQGSARTFCFSEYLKREVVPFLLLGPCILMEGKSFYKQRPARFGIEINASSIIYSLNKASFDLIEAKYPELKPSFRLMVKEQTKSFKIWQRELLILTAKQRHEKLVASQSKLLKSMLKKDIAAHIGVTEQSFSRLIKKS